MDIWYTGVFDNGDVFIYTEEIDLSEKSFEQLKYLFKFVLNDECHDYDISNKSINIRKLNTKNVNKVKRVIESVLLLKGEL